MIPLYKGVIDVISNIVGNVVISEADYDKIFKDLGLDSLDTFNILLELEEKYEISFPEEDIEKLNTINSLVKYIEESKNE